MATTGSNVNSAVNAARMDDVVVRKGRGRSASKVRAKVLTYVGLVIASVLAVFPLLFMIFSSFKSDDRIFSDLGSLRAFLPVGHLSFDNYVGVFGRVPATRFILNSVVVTVCIVVLGLVVNSVSPFLVCAGKERT